MDDKHKPMGLLKLWRLSFQSLKNHEWEYAWEGFFGPIRDFFIHWFLRIFRSKEDYKRIQYHRMLKFYVRLMELKRRSRLKAVRGKDTND